MNGKRRRDDGDSRGSGVLWFLSVLCCLIAVAGPARAAEASVCATVKIEIRQELTLERQGFDAHMRINNGFDHISLTNVDIDVKFTDVDGETVLASSGDTNAVFYIRVDSMANIDDVDGVGVVAPATAADIHWLIIPMPGAGGADLQGTLYYVGATLTYNIGAEQHVTEVVPDYIYVKPMPDLVLDYFLPHQVYGDDAFTPETEEPPIPFSLGLRVKNTGYGAARNLKIDTGQPEIVRNDTGLLVSFVITDAEVNGQPSKNSLLVDFGDIEPSEAGLARWTMECSLSGTFTNFSAFLSHADELGGRLTSLIQETNVNTHMLLHDVLADLPGRDTIRDFLTDENMLYESDGTDSAVSNISTTAGLSGGSEQFTLTNETATSGFIYAKLTNSAGTNMVLEQVVRSDGKELPESNYWLSATRDGTNAWEYFFNLFDVNAGSASYSIEYEAIESANDPPVLAYIGSKTGYTNQPAGFAVSATDTNDATPALSTGSLPVGANFADNGDGTGSFSWTPTEYQAGEYRIKFTAFDGELADSETITLEIVGGEPPSWPAWWDERDVLDPNATATNDYAAVNQGQVKHIAHMAWNELNTLPGGAEFTLSLSNADNYVAANIGQLKNLAAPFYDRLDMAYPWSGPSTNDFALANIGQVKNLFCFDPKYDTDGDGMPDWWEEKYFDNPTNAVPSADPDGDTHKNLYEYSFNTNPTNGF